jgi:flagellar biosynthetic protein FliR
MPVVGTRGIPARVRLVFGLALGLSAWSAAGAPAAVVPGAVSGLVRDVMQEGAVGLLAGLGARFLLLAASGAGTYAGVAMGLGFGALVDPATGTRAPVVSRIVEWLAVGAAVGLGLHRQAVVWLALGLRASPPGTPMDLREAVGLLLAQGAGALLLAIQLGLPVVMAATVGHLVMGTLGRLAPQLNLMSVGFSVAILAGGAALFATAPGVSLMAARAAFSALTP